MKVDSEFKHILNYSLRIFLSWTVRSCGSVVAEPVVLDCFSRLGPPSEHCTRARLHSLETNAAAVLLGPRTS